MNCLTYLLFSLPTLLSVFTGINGGPVGLTPCADADVKEKPAVLLNSTLCIKLSSRGSSSSRPPASTSFRVSSTSTRGRVTSTSTASTRSSSTTSSTSRSTTTSTSSTSRSSTTSTLTSPTSTSMSSTSSAPMSTMSATTNGGGASQSDIAAYLQAHNSVRAQHNAVPLTWNTDAAAKAQIWAVKCVFQHSGGTLGPYGENLAAGTGTSYGIAAAVKSWTDEISEYNSSDPKASHYTQVVWRGSTQLGCAVQTCSGIFPASYGPAKFYVCEYSPQGNIIGHQNVQ